MRTSTTRGVAALALVIAGAAAACSAAPVASPRSVPSPSPAGASSSPSGSPVAQPPAASSPGTVPTAGPIAAGTYRVKEGLTTDVGYDITLPDGWIAENGGQTLSKHPNEPGELFLNPFVVDKIFADPCGPDDVLSVDPGADALARALASRQGPEVSEPSEVSLGGLPATLVELAYPDGLDPETCDPPIGLQVWQNVPGDKYLVLVPDGRLRVYLADVGDRRLVIAAGFRAQSSASDIAELDAIVSSIRIERG